jgi:membrane protein required for colicin V production
MAFLDIVLGILLLYGLIRGIWNGFFVEFASLVSLLVGIYVAIKFSNLTKNSIAPHVPWNPKTIQIVAFALTFILVAIGISILAKAFTSIANFAGLGIFNKLLGGFFGFVKMVLILSVTLTLFAKINSGNALAEKETIDKSLFFNPILKMAALIYPSLESWHAGLRPETISIP